MPNRAFAFHGWRVAQKRWALSIGPLVANVGMATNYAFAGPTQLRASAIIAYVDDTLRLWTIGFSVASGVLFAALVTTRFLAGAHVVTSALFAGYSFALVLGTALASGLTWASASMSIAIALYTTVLALIYARAK